MGSCSDGEENPKISSDFKEVQTWVKIAVFVGSKNNKYLGLLFL